MNRVLIIGGAGFIGSHTADLLLSNGYEVTLYDNLSEKTHLNKKWPNYINRNAKKVLANVLDEKILLEELKKTDYIIHLAAEMDLNPEFKKFMDVNVGSTALIYELIIKHNINIKKVIVASSQFVYGEGNWKCKKCGVFSAELRSKNQMLDSNWDIRCPKCDCNNGAEYCLNKESHQNPPNHYALSKYFQEKISIQLGLLYNIPSVAMRYSIVHGPNQSLKNTYSGALRTFAICTKIGRKISTFEDNMSLRDYISVYDVARANLLVLQKDEANYEVFNVGGGESLTVKELATEVSKQFNKDCKFSSVKEFRVGDIRHAISDISKLKNLGWEPIYKEKDTIKEYVNWFKTQDFDKEKFERTQLKMRNEKIIIKAKK